MQAGVYQMPGITLYFTLSLYSLYNDFRLNMSIFALWNTYQKNDMMSLQLS